MQDPFCHCHRTLSRIVASLLGAAVVVVASAQARAQSCDALPGFVRETYPASGSRSVPRNGLVSVLYCPSEQVVVDRSATRLLVEVTEAGVGCACPADTECLEVARVDRCLREVDTTTDVLDDEVILQTPAPLEATTAYVIEAPEPDGPVRVRFTTGTAVDEAPPEFSGVASLEIDGCGPGFADNVACPADLEEDGFVVVLEAPAARDEAGAVNIEYRVFQHRGDQRIERGRARGDGVSDVAMSLFIAGSDLTADEWERICFSMTARDPYGHETSPDRVLCEQTPEFSPFGNACAVAAGAGERSGAGLGLLLLGAIAIVRASSARSRRRSGVRSAGNR